MYKAGFLQNFAKTLKGDEFANENNFGLAKHKRR